MKALTCLIIALSYSLIGCDGMLNSAPSIINTANGPTITDQELAPYKARFLEVAEQEFGQTYNTDNLSLKFGEMEDEDTVAICNLFYSGDYAQVNITRREIVVNPAFWNVSDIAKDNFMIHEFGHCLNYREHVTSQVFFPMEAKNGPSSLMYPNPIAMMGGYGPGFYERNLEYYLQELFNTNTYGTIFNTGSSGQAMKRSFEIRADGACKEHHEQIYQ